jgi:ribonuclease P protein component
MISRTHRFHGHNSLNFVYRQGKSINHRQIGVKFVFNSRRPTWRAAVVVSKKVHKSAVARNRIRRKFYEAIRHSPPTKAYDIVVTIFDSELAHSPQTDIEKLTQTLFDKAGLN